MTNVAAFILIISTWGNNGAPVYSMQEFSSEESCKAAQDYVYKHLIPPNDRTVLVKCVAK